MAFAPGGAGHAAVTGDTIKADTVAVAQAVAADTAVAAPAAILPATAAAGHAAPVAKEANPNDTLPKTRMNKAKGFNALDYILERRYLSGGDKVGGSWWSTVFLEAGFGGEWINAPTGAYRFNTLSSFRFAIGKRFNGLNSLRLTAHGEFGFLETSNLLLGKVGGRADHLFSLTSYFDGYNPARFFELSSVLGVGLQMSQLRRNSSLEPSLEAHVGLQLKFYTGPQGSISLEPYIGVCTDQGDVSQNRNWRKYDFFCGATASYVYYLGNNLSRERRRKLVERRHKGDRIGRDSVLQSWQRPWFVELAAGPHFMDAPGVGFFSSVGHETSVAIGKWLSPVIGVRMAASMRSATFATTEVSSPAPSYETSYERSQRKAYLGGRIDALINPLGFAKSFAWDKPFGFHLLVGGEVGRMVRYDSEMLNCWSISYSAGAQFWARLSDGVRLFVEPRGSWYVYNIPYADVRNRSIKCTDGGMTVNIGLSVSTYDRRYRTPAPAADRGRFTVGGGIGTNLAYQRSKLKGSGMGYNAHAWGEYAFDRLSSVRAAFEYVSLSSLHEARFVDYNLTNPDRPTRTTRSGVWQSRYHVGFASLAYVLDFTEALCGPRRRTLFDVKAYAGPALMFVMGESSSLHESERLQQHHEARLAKPAARKAAIGGTVGVRLTANVTPRLGVYLAPSFYVWRLGDLPGVQFMITKHVETLNLGVQYNL